ncbi:hypothetical protein UNSWDHB_2230 [Dehalobacter sp. UNSWDHB]|jgi:hypothetical protein|uniref:AbrB/MazE/SpoVT family DNA-binding domain-containing protein n=1 Tax=Dehalobacter TaxID=56112 RepID=UPI00028AC696|nr:MULTISPECIES: AbrB/MazE/SpoVT family DNA-binding domain-containing protein [unclassified Dehalobacter]AFV02318.1 hypothetical protein DHBDCA_p1289 [Dehalobacter sp. DCA]AFV05361.1 hypothetical protein DCF50_p1355 [Dehalobacter sp. CF]EQB20495.1 hypothetical protein UNSWDHB_2230 [Dehalobacter sp. UNSWDHB]
MKMIEIESTVDLQGKLTIPACLMEDLGLVPGDTVRLVCVSKSLDDPINTFGEILIASNGMAGLEEMEAEEWEISLPNELLEAANIPLSSDIEIICTEGAIIITAADLLDMIPDELCQLFAELGISPEAVRSVIKSGGFLDGQ